MKKPIIDAELVISLKEKDYDYLFGKLNEIASNPLDPSTFSIMYFLMQHQDEFVRLNVIDAITKVLANTTNKNKEILLPLILIGIGDKECRYNALPLLRYYPENTFFFLLTGILLQDKNPLVRVQASELIIELKQPEGIPFLEEALTDKAPLVRAYSAYGLALLESAASVPLLFRLQKNERNTQVKAACWGGLLLLTKEPLWLNKMLNSLGSADYHVPMQIITYLDDAIEKNIVEPEDAILQVQKYLQKETRVAVSSRMADFIEDYTHQPRG